jgi:hypothetical protein
MSAVVAHELSGLKRGTMEVPDETDAGVTGGADNAV